MRRADQGVRLHNEVYDGSHSLKFSLPNGNQNVTSTSTITLEANTTYSLSAMFEYGGQGDTANPGVKGYVRLVGDGLTTTEVSWNSTNWRGIQLREGTFTTGSTSETYYVQVGIEGGAALNPVTAKPFYIDDIKIQRTKTYGITAAAHSWSIADYPGISRYGVGTNATIKNGTIVQGANGATWGHGVFVHETSGVTIQDLNITVRGANSSVINGKNQGTFSSSVHGNTLTSNVTTITSRDNFNGAVVYGLQGDIYENTITNGVHAGIVTASGVASNIYSNTIQLKARYTNAFAIRADHGSQIYNNTINCGSGEYTARGIMASGQDGLATTKVYGNTIDVQGKNNNQEYEGVPIGGVYGIQIEDAKNVEVFNNFVTARGNTTIAYAFRMNSAAVASIGVSVHDNVFEAVSNGAHAASVKFSTIESAYVIFAGNTLITNDGIVGATADATFTLIRSHVKINMPIADPYPIESDYSSDPGLHTIISFLDTSFEDAASRAYLGSAIARTASRYGGLPDNRIAFNQKWTTTIQVNDSGSTALPNAQVTITDKLGNQVFSGLSNANGQVVTALTEFQTQGGTKTGNNPFTVTANSNGQQVQQQFTADKTQTVTVQITGPVGSGSSSSAILPSYVNAVGETQDLLAAGPTVSFEGRELRVTGTDLDDQIAFVRTGSTISIVGVSGSWTARQVKSIVVDLKGGDDRVSLDSLANGGDKALKEHVTILGGAGTRRVGAGAYHDIVFSGQDSYAQVNSKGRASLNSVPLNLASSATGVLSRGLLTVTGTNGADNLKFAQVSGKIYISGVSGAFSASKVKSIVVRLQDGDDLASLDSLANGGNQTLAELTTTYSGVGSEMVHLANGHDVNMNGPGHTLQVAANGTAILDGQTLSWDPDPPPINWFDANIQDAALRSLGHNLYVDGLIDRSDILALLNDTKDGGIIDGTELADLRRIADNASLFGSNGCLHRLTNYTAYGSAANTNYQGQALGNLDAGAASVQMDQLVNKWFLGLDRPVAGGTYRQMAGSLFVSGAAYTDVRQGAVGDNYFLASLAETAFRDSNAIVGMFLVNGDGTYGVKFYNPQGQAEYVTVDSYLPTDANGKLTYASRGQTYNSTSNELWVALAEKAYAQLNEFGWSRTGYAASGQNSYAALDGGYIHQALNQISNSPTTAFAFTSESTSFDVFVSAYSAGKRIGFASFSTPVALSGIVGNHAYAVVGYNTSAQTVTLFNPWGIEFGLTTLNWSQIQQNFEYFDRTA